MQGLRKAQRVARLRGLLLVVALAGMIAVHGVPANAIKGDVAPYGMPDGVLNVADLVIARQFITGDRLPAESQRLALDVAPSGAPDGIIDGADYQVLERAVLGLVALDPLQLPEPPQLWQGQRTVTQSRYHLSGLAVPDARIIFYRDGQQAGEAVASGSGLFSYEMELIPGALHTIHATQVVAGAESRPSGSLSVTCLLPGYIDRSLIAVNYDDSTYPANDSNPPANVFITAAPGSVNSRSVVRIILDDGSIRTLTAAADGSFALALAAYEDVGGVLGRSAGVASISVASTHEDYVVPGTFAGNSAVDAGGAFTYSIALAVPPGTAGLAPALSLDFSSRTGNGPLGRGWLLGGLSAISRCQRTVSQDGEPGGVNLDDGDRFCLDGQRLVAVSGDYGADQTEYRTETESFTRIISYGGTAAMPAYFMAWTRAGQLLRYGFSEDAAFNPGGGVTLHWSVDRVEDRSGNYFQVQYREDQAAGEHYPLQLDYTGNDRAGVATYNSIRFIYEPRPDPSTGYIGGQRLARTQRLQAVQVFADTIPVREYRLSYDSSPMSGQSRLVRISECDSTDPDAVCLRPVRFDWSSGSHGFLPAVSSGTASSGYQYAQVLDANGDGRQDLLVPHAANRFATNDGRWWIQYGSDSGLLPEIDTGIATAGAYPGSARLLDYDNDGLEDLLVTMSDGYYNLLKSGVTGLTEIDNVLRNIGSDLQPLVLDIDGRNGQDLAWIANSTGSGPNTYHVSLNAAGGLQAAVDSGMQEIFDNHAIVVDYNNNGKQDMLFRFCLIGCNTIAYEHIDGGFGTVMTPLIPGSTGFSDRKELVMDVNGDGLQDIVAPFDATWKVFLNTGRSHFAQAIDTGLADTAWQYARSIDYNSDGRQDLLFPAAGTWQVYLASGVGFEQVDTGLAANGYTDARLMDVNGDGLQDIVSPYNGVWNVHLRAGVQTDQLTGILDSSGSATSISYRPLTDHSLYSRQSGAVYPDLDYQGPLYVVSQTGTDDGAGGRQITNYSYSGARVNLTGRGVLGFREVTRSDPQSGLATTTRYLQSFPFVGVPEIADTYLDGVLIAHTENIWLEKTSYNGSVHFPYTGSSTETSYDLPDRNGSAGALIKTVRKDASYDDSGNLLMLDIATTGGGVTFTSETTNTYYPPDPVNWVLDQVSRTEVVHIASNVSSPHNRITKTSAFGYYPAGHPNQFLLRDEIIEPDAGADSPLYLATTREYDVFGNQVRVITQGLQRASAAAGAGARVTTTEYDTQGRFPVRTINALGHEERYQHDPRFGSKTRLTGPNGLATSWVYDGFGRKLLESRADGNTTSWRYDFCTLTDCPHGGFIETVEAEGGLPVITYHDVLQRPVRTRTVSFSGQAIYQDIAYDTYGNVASRSRAYFAGAAPQFTTFQHDILGRPVREDAPDGGIVEYEYTGFARNARRHHVNGGYDQYDTRINDAMDRLVHVVDAMNGSQGYQYDAAGDLVSTTDHNGNTTRYTYDLRGRKMSMDDPDMGIWRYQYNGFGEQVWQRDAKGQVVFLFYDALGRQIRRSEPEGVSTWVYDAADHGVGRLSSATTPLDVHNYSYTYDELGRLASESSSIDGRTLVMAYSYDGNSRRATLTYPDGFMVRNVYNDLGILTEVRDAANDTFYWRLDEDDAEGHITAETLGNGLQTLRGYNTASGSLTAISTGAGATAGIQSMAYVFDALGNLYSRTDLLQGRTEAFSYDDLNRLQGSAISGLGMQSYGYDTLGNITRKSDFGDEYEYGSNRPHAVTTVRQAGLTRASYSYDANGNMTSGDGRDITWTSFNKAARVTKGAETVSFTYDAEHNRVKQVDGDTITYYLNPGLREGVHYEEEVAGPVTGYRHYIHAAGRAVAIYTIMNNTRQVRYLHTDHLGSMEVITDANGQVVERMSFAAFGTRRHSDWSNPGSVPAAIETHHGFTGHEQLDNVGLVHMNGRLYDPKLGRFLSPDPQVQYPDQTQSFNRYTYVNNNPLSHVDPGGYGFFSKLWKKIKAVFKNPRALIGIATGFLTGFATWAALGYGGGFIWGGTATIAGISAAAGTFVTSLVITNGDISASFRAGLVSGFLAFAGVQIRQGIRDYLRGKGTLYNVHPDADRASDYTLVPANSASVQDRLFVNGMNNSLSRAAELGLHQFYDQSFTLYYNPSHGFLADLTESALGKLFGNSGLSRGLADILQQHPSLTVIAHSQGGIIATNAIEHLSGMQLNGLRLTLNGAAVAERTARAAVEGVGGTLVAYNAHPLDLVPNVIALNTLNPARVVGSLVSAPFLFTADSPHAAFY